MEERSAALARYGPLRTWNTQHVQDFDHTFFIFLDPYRFPGGQRAGEDDDITGWDTSAAITMNGMFMRCTKFNQPLRFNTHAVTSMSRMFDGCTSFNQPLTFNTGACQRFELMFRGCTSFNQPLTFNTGAVTSMSMMFYGCTAFNQPLDFDTHAVTSMSMMFEGCTAFNQPLHRWRNRPSENLQNLKTMGMFEGCVSFQGPVFQMSVTEYGRSGLNHTPLGQSAVMQKALEDARHVTNPVTQGRIITQASREAARALGAPVHDAEMAARVQARADYSYRPKPKREDYYVDRPPDDDDDGRSVRQRRE